MTALSNWGLAFVFNKGSTPRVGGHDIYIGEITKIDNWNPGIPGIESCKPFVFLIEGRGWASSTLYCSDPSTADDEIAVIEDNSLSGSDGALGIVKGDANFAVSGRLNYGGCRLMAMADLCLHAHGRICMSARCVRCVII